MSKECDLCNIFWQHFQFAILFPSQTAWCCLKVNGEGVFTATSIIHINGFKKDSMCGNDFNIYRASAVERLSESLQNNKIKISLETQESIFRDFVS